MTRYFSIRRRVVSPAVFGKFKFNSHGVILEFQFNYHKSFFRFRESTGGMAMAN